MYKYRTSRALLTFSAFCAIVHHAYAIDINQASIPYVIAAPGQYNVVEDLTYNGNGNAITITSDQVELNINGFSITLSQNEAVGIRATDVSDIWISNGTVINSTVNTNRGAGIHVSNIHNIHIRDINTFNNRNGLFIKKSHDVEVINCNCADATMYGTLVKESKSVIFNSCVFNNGQNGLKLKTDNKEFEIRNCSFPTAQSSNLLVQEMEGLLIENCLFNNQSYQPCKKAIVQFGSAKQRRECYDVIMRNCTVINSPQNEVNRGKGDCCNCTGSITTSPEGIGIYRGEGFLIESCIIDIDNSNQDPAKNLSAIHIGNPNLRSPQPPHNLIATNVIINDCIIQGSPTNGIYADNGSTGVVIESCLINGALKNGIFLGGTSQSTVANNTIVNNATNGIFIGAASTSNTIANNTVNNNGTNPIASSLAPQGNGISIASDSSLNLIQGNDVFMNAVNGVDDEGTNNHIFSNIAYANANLNYYAATDVIVVSNPGDPALMGANISA